MQIAPGVRRWASRVLTLAFFTALLWFLIDRAGTMNWPEVVRTIRRYEFSQVALALALALSSYLACCGFDLMARRHIGHRLPVPVTAAIAFVSYAFTINLGAFVGGMGFRYRLYSRFGLAPATITQIIGFSLLTNWSGYVLLAGLTFAFAAPHLPADWQVPDMALRLSGVLLLGMGAAYLGLCLVARGRSWSIRGMEIICPSLRLAALQLSASSVSWLLIAATMDRLLPDAVPFMAVVTTLFVSAIAGVLTHVPSGIGVLEAVCVALLSHYAPAVQILAALLMYRAVYYIAPLLIALLLYPLLEAFARVHPSVGGSNVPLRFQGRRRCLDAR